MSGIVIRTGDWATLGEAAMRVRETVFVHEQGVPLELEVCARDPDCLHALAQDAQGRVVGTGRLLPDGHIGRMAVLREWRGRGVGAALLEGLVEEARARGHAEAVLSAQCHALDFYARHGFVAEGDIYLDAGIEHRTMRRRLLPVS